MKKAFACLLLLVIIACSGCNASQTEVLYIQDELLSVSPHAVYSVSVQVPAQCAMSDTQADHCIYEADDGSYCVITRTYENWEVGQVMKDMTGFSRDELGVLTTQRFSMPEYRFTWTTQGEEGLLVCTGMILSDGDTCYTLQFRAREADAKALNECKREIFASYGLFTDEGC